MLKGSFHHIIALSLLLSLGGCDFLFDDYAPGNYKRYNKTETKQLKQKSNKRARDFLLQETNSYWKNPYLVDLKFHLEETKSSVVAIGRKRKVINSKYTPEKQVYNIQKKCYLELPDTSKKDNDLQYSATKLKPEENCFYNNLDEGKEMIIETNDIILKSTDFAALDSWDYDNFADAMESFLNSCTAFERYQRQKINIANKSIMFGKIEDWIKTCKIAIKYNQHQEYKAFFENHFKPFAVFSSKNNRRGTFTGYYEITIEGSRQKTNKYRYPVYRKPPECAKKSTCYTRKEISDGVLKNRGLELYWVSDFIDLWRMQMQGSGIIDFEDGTYARVGFGGGNGYAYRRFLDYFNNHDVLPPGNHSASFIYQWMRDNPETGIKAMNHNPSYLFFVPLSDTGRSSKGAQVVPLTPSRSGAVDSDYIPLGMPMWIETKASIKHEFSGKWIELNRLVVAQDIGSAIKGPVRMDIFFGHGPKARYLAETTRYDGQYYMLVPTKALANIKKI